MARHLCDVIIEEIFNQSEYFVDADFYNEEHQASRDIYVITNLINAMLLRHIDIPHELQKSMDDAKSEDNQKTNTTSSQ